MTGGLRVRVARDDELEAAGEVVAEAYRPMPGMDEDPGYLEHVRDARGRAADVDVLVAVDDGGAILGCASYVREHTSPLAELERPDEAGIRMVGVAPWALLVGLAAATPSPWARAAAVVALVAAAWQSPVLRGPDPVQVATWRAHDAVVRDLRHHVGPLPDGARVDVVIPHHRRPSFEALRAADDEGRGQHRGGQALGWVGETERVRFRSVVVYAVDAPVLHPVAVLEGGEVGLPVGTELLQQHDVEVHERGDRTWVAPQQPAPYLYVHDGVRGVLVPPSGREGG